eukprot:c26582_g1_i1 orf=432-1358(+)
MEVKQMTANALVKKLESKSLDLQRQGVCELRLHAKWDMDNKICIAEAGAVPLLVNLLSFSDAQIQENAVTTLLNLSIHPRNRKLIMESPGFLDVICGVIKTGKSAQTKENSAALLFSLMVEEEYRPVIGQRSDAIEGLLDLVRLGSPRGRKDAIKSLFHMSLHHDNKARLVAAGTVPVLFSLIIQSKEGLVEDSLAVLAQVAACVESVPVFRRLSAVTTLVGLLETGSSRAQENAASALLNLCQSGGEAVIEDVLDTNSCLSSLSHMLRNGTNRGKSKANSLMKLLLVTGGQSEQEDWSCSVSSISTR